MKDFITTYRNEHLDNLREFYEKKGMRASMADSLAFSAYRFTNDYQLTVFTVERMPFEQDFGEFMYTLEKAGIKEFQLADMSTGLMDSIHYLLKTGWEIAGTDEIVRSDGEQRCLIMRKK